MSNPIDRSRLAGGAPGAPRRTARGDSAVELAVGLIVLLPVLLLLFDLAIIVLAVQQNNSTAREGARVAAQGDPNTANGRAQAIVNRANQQTSGRLASNFRLVAVNFTPNDLLAQEAALGQLGGQLKGSVSVQTEVDVRPFVVQYAYGGRSPLQFRSQETYPITYIVPNTATNAAGP